MAQNRYDSAGRRDLNRPTRRWFNSSNSVSATTNGSLPSGVAATDEVAYFYDSQTLPSGAPSYTRGHSTGALVAVTYGGGSSGTYRGYDALGRVVRQYQRTDSVNYLTEATYYVDGSLHTEVYPAVPGASDRRTVTYTPDSAGRLASWSSSSTTYAAAASVSSGSGGRTSARVGLLVTLCVISAVILVSIGPSLRYF